MSAVQYGQSGRQHATGVGAPAPAAADPDGAGPQPAAQGGVPARTDPGGQPAGGRIGDQTPAQSRWRSGPR